ncbi:MAG TPA: DUF2249 domain-containing protein [Candidatus Sulfotelmatobacter sp.]|nr:DUF2249 domain-containing protein [Candidatus Sulfotelmatobacter sp.]
MQLSADTRVSDLLDAYPQAVDVLAELNPHFAKLRNRVLRKLMAPRVTVGQAAQMAQVDVGAMLTVLARATGQAPPPACCGGEPAGPQRTSAPERPPFLDQFAGDRLVTLDVREDIRRGQEPFARIMAAARGLRPGQALLLRNLFEPVPLYQVLAKKGLDHWTMRAGPEDWSVYFYPAPTEGADAAAATEAPPPAPRQAGEVVVDARGLEPPQPMQRILEALAALPEGEALRAHTDRRPMLLYPKLEERGYRYETREAGDDGYETRIWR